MVHIEQDPSLALPHGGEHGVQFKTGDPVFDLWEEASSKGETPDFDSYISPNDLETVKRWSRAVTAQALPGVFLESDKDRALLERPPVPTTELKKLVGDNLDDDLFEDGFDDDYTPE